MTDKRVVAALIVTILIILMIRQVDGKGFDTDKASCKSSMFAFYFLIFMAILNCFQTNIVPTIGR